MKRIILIILALLLFAAPAVAGTSRVLPVAYNTSTFGGAGRNYTTLQAWEDATDNDLVTAAKGEVLVCYPDSTSYNQYVNISGATTNSSYFRVIKNAPGSSIVITSTNSDTMLVNEKYLGIYDLKLINNDTVHTLSRIIDAQSSTTYLKLVGCEIGPNNNNTNGMGIWTESYSQNSIYVINCYIHNVSSALIGVYHPGGNTSFFIYNSLVDTAITGINCSGGTINVIVKNSIIRNVTTTVTGSTVTQTTCLFTTGAGLVLFAPVMPKILKADTAAQDKGTSLSADAAFPFNDDYFGATRPSGIAWDIGPHELQGNGHTVIVCERKHAHH